MDTSMFCVPEAPEIKIKETINANDFDFHKKIVFDVY